jgi:hypothetical protein
MVTWLRAVVDAVLADDVSGKGLGALATIALVVPFGWVLLLFRLPAIFRRLIRGLPEGVPPF